MPISTNVGKWDDPVILQCNYPEIADVSETDYVAKNFKGNQVRAIQHPFIVCADQAVTLKVEPWLGEPLIWKFVPGPNAFLLRRIYNDAANKITETGVAITSIQIAY